MGRSRSRSPPRRRRREDSRSPPRPPRRRSRSRSREDDRAQERRPQSPMERREATRGPIERTGEAQMQGGQDRRPDRARPKEQEKEGFQQEGRYEWGKPQDDEEGKAAKPPAVVEKANFGLTGALAKDARTGNTYKGVTLKWSEPADAHKPARGWRLYVFKKDKNISTLHLHRQSAYLIGRLDIADLKVEHPSCSKQHAVLQFRLRELRDEMGQVKRVVKPYIMDLESVNKTRLNKEEIPPARYIELKVGDMLQFGMSSREYVLLHESVAEGGKPS